MRRVAHAWLFLRFSPRRSLLTLLVLTAALLIAIIGGRNADAGAPSFAAKQDFTTGAGPFYVAVGDFNNDGKPDVAVSNNGSGTVSVLLNTTGTGATTFSFAANQDFFAGANPAGVAVADFNGDGKLDLAVASMNDQVIGILLNTTTPGNSTMSFLSKQDFATGASPRGVKVGDFNLDGLPDLAVVNSASGVSTVSVLLNTTTPGATTASFATRQDFATGGLPWNVALGDINGDGKVDMAVQNGADKTVSVFINNTAPGASTPAFAAKQDFATANGPSGITMGDVNEDGQLDIITGNGAGSVSVLLNTTVAGSNTAGFVARQDFVATPLQSVVAIDLNGDGRLDLAGAGPLANAVTVLQNNTVPGSATAVFAAKQDFAAGTGATATAAGDFNGDGQPDLVAANFNPNTISVFCNTSVITPATPAFTPKQDFATGATPFAAAVGDLNGDGVFDLAVANFGDNSVSVLLNSSAPGAGTISFNPKQDFGTGASPQFVTLGDLNGDGKLDLIVPSFSGNTLSVLLNTTAPGATTPSFATKQDFSMVSGSKSIAVGDLNQDGRLDLAVTNQGSGSVSVLLNTTAPGSNTLSFAARQDFTTGAAPTSVTVGDLNGDGQLDLTVANFNSGTVSVLLNTTAPGAGTPSFAARQDFTTGNSPFFVAVADLNGDGRPDMAVANNGSASASVLLNTSAPGAASVSFASKQDFNTNTNPQALALGDVSGDGKLDLIVANFSSSNVSVLVNTTAPGATVPSFAAKQDVAPNTSPRFVTVGDINRDGKPDLVVPNSFANNVSVLLNTPTIVTATGLSRQQGSASSNSQIATATNYGGNGNLTVAVASANPSNGVTISNIVNTNGNVTADIIAGCAATNATFTLQATDGSSTVTGTLNVTATANSAPTLTYSSPQSVAFNGSLNVTPTTATDNGSISSYVVQSVAPAMTTAPTVTAGGVVSIVNAQPAGSHVITIRATDNCGSTTDAAFTLNVSKAATSTAVTSSPNPSFLAQSVTFTATVTSSVGTPSGTAQFKIDGVNLGSPAPLSAGGVAQLVTNTLSPGTHTVSADYSGDTNFNSSTGTLAGGQVVNNRPLLKLSQSSYSVNESTGFVTIAVDRGGDTSVPVTVDYATDDTGASKLCSTLNSGLASSQCDFALTLGTLRFAANETQKTFVITITQDSFNEGPEAFNVNLSNVTGANAALNTPSSATVTINNSAGPAPNAIDDASNFVRMHYHDFLNREPDQSGLDFWTGQITSCGSDAACTEVKRINVSAAFFLSIEFQQTGYLVERMYKTAYGDGTGASALGGAHQLPVPIVRFNEFLRDTQRIGQGVVVLAPGWEQALENNKQAYALEFVQTARFTAANAFPTTMTPTQFVDKLNQNAGNVLSPGERTTAINLFSGAADTSNTTARAQALRQVAENTTLYNAEFNRAFVLAEFFGYLRRNPNDLPDTDYTGYDFWLGKLNQFNGDYIAAEMVKAFISSNEYRQRFGP